MKFASDLLFRLARSTAGSRLDGDEGELEIGTEISPVLVIPGPQTDLAAFLETLIQRESFCFAIARDQPAATAEFTAPICTFARGLWDILLQGSYISSFDSVGAGNGGEVRLLDDDGTAAVLMRFNASANRGQNSDVRIQILFPEDGWQLQIRHAATAAGQTAALTASVLANRLF